MKKVVFATLGFVSISLLSAFSLRNTQTGDFNQNLSPDNISEDFYQSLSCTTEDGKTGCRCASSPDSDCDPPATECKSGSALPHFTMYLEANYSDEEIALLGATPTPIEDPGLREALEQDGWKFN